jgi:hypothetical protein
VHGNAMAFEHWFCDGLFCFVFQDVAAQQALSKWTGFPSRPGESQGCHLTIPRALFSEYNDSNSMDCCSTNDMDAKVDGQR